MSRSPFELGAHAARALVLISLFIVSGTAVRGDTLAGRLELSVKNGTRPSRSARADEAVVFFVPAGDVPRAALEPSEAVITTLKKEFIPRAVTILVGGSVRFPNEDPILHNVFSLSKGNDFDVGLYNRGPGEPVKFDVAGLVRVYCNVHDQMAAIVNVLPSPYHVTPDASGSFSLTDLPTGGGTLVAWHPRTDPVELPVSGSREDLVLDLRVTRPRVARHLNKLGKPYGD